MFVEKCEFVIQKVKIRPRIFTGRKRQNLIDTDRNFGKFLKKHGIIFKIILKIIYSFYSLGM